MKIPLSSPLVEEDDIKAVADVLRTPQLSLGPKLVEFEKLFSEYVGREHSIAVNSGTSGLHLCMRALDIKDGDEVITTPFSFIASANCILFERAKPVFVDIDEKTLNIDVGKIEAAITEKTKAILPVHVFGLPCDMPGIRDIAKKHGLKVVEDSCEALGAEFNGQKAGTFGDASVFAFYPNKQLTVGEGGMVVTDSEEIADTCRSLRNQGRSKNGGWLDHEQLGYNYRLDEMSCALGVSQIKKASRYLETRSKVASWYNDFLKDVENVIIPEETVGSAKRSWFVYVVLLENANRDEVLKKMNEKGVECKPYFQPIHLQPLYAKKYGFSQGDFPVCEKISGEALALPFYTQMEIEKVEKVCETLKECM